ncbi:unnamed protein product, partial [Urochloa humidicola]
FSGARSWQCEDTCACKRAAEMDLRVQVGRTPVTSPVSRHSPLPVYAPFLSPALVISFYGDFSRKVGARRIAYLRLLPLFPSDLCID